MACLFKGVKKNTISNSLQVEYHKIVVKLCKFKTKFRNYGRLLVLHTERIAQERPPKHRARRARCFLLPFCDKAGDLWYNKNGFLRKKGFFDAAV